MTTMNLTPEELQFFRAQRLTASTDAIGFNFGLSQQLLAVIPAQQLPGPSFPVPLATMNHEELNTWKDKLRWEKLFRPNDSNPCYLETGCYGRCPCTANTYGPSKSKQHSAKPYNRIQFCPKLQFSTSYRLCKLRPTPSTMEFFNA